MASDNDRTVHARSADGETELVRYDKAGRWWLEGPPVVNGRLTGIRMRTVADAAATALALEKDGGEIMLFQPGGQQFDSKVRGARAKKARHSR